ncbi:MAG TPA: response regulator transcription factor [Verrucomicrobiae bacterium]|nr:response regulator transcription factor [Verrucomicrobiae bacterium]
MPVKVSIVEDNDRVRESLTSLIEGAPGFRCVGAHRSAEAALKLVPEEKPDVVLMDIHLPRLCGIDCVRKLKAIEPHLLVLMLTAYEDDDLIFQALKAGANGYLVKQTPPSEILAAIEEVHEGGAPMSSNIARKVIQSFHSAGPNEPTETLSPREREILDLLARGYTNKEIADLLSIAFQTVHTHVRNIYGKLHVRSRTEAVAKYLRPQ